MDTVVSESDDVGASVAVHVGDLARGGVVAGPALRAAEVFQRNLGRAEGAVGLPEGHVGAGVAETDDVGPPVAVHVGDLAVVDVIADPPARACVGTEPIRSIDHHITFQKVDNCSIVCGY